MSEREDLGREGEVVHACWGQPSPWLASSRGGWRSQCAAALAGVVGALPSSHVRARTAVLSLRSSRARQRVVLLKGRPVLCEGGRVLRRGGLGRTPGTSTEPAGLGFGFADQSSKLDTRSAPAEARRGRRGLVDHCAVTAVRTSSKRLGSRRGLPTSEPPNPTKAATAAARRHGHHQAPAADTSQKKPDGQHAVFPRQHRQRVFVAHGPHIEGSKSR